MPRVLILTASYGSGHNEAARALAAEFEAQGSRATIVDHFGELVHPRFAQVTRTLYYTLLRKAPAIWASAYAVADRIASDSPLTFGMTRVGTAGLRARLAELSPDFVVTVHATPAAVMSSLAMAGERVPPHTTVVTDFVAHRQWMAEKVDRYCVAAEEVRHEFLARGIPASRVVVTGVPLRPEFLRRVDPGVARTALGLSPDLPVVLAMAGSHGSLGRLESATRAILATERPLQGLVVAGRDEELRTRLESLVRGSSSLRVLGYVSDVRGLMAAADLLITKAGGMTLAEATAAELPMLLWGSLPGQERRNEGFAARAGVALVARSRRELSRHLERALGDPDLLAALRARTDRVRRPDAAQRIVAEVLERLPRAV
jgi:processive 1,2-diacylglycerol beta-glucosyltransferase